MRARACIKCKEYVIIHANNPLNQMKVNSFEKRHHLHTLITVNLEEIKDEYHIYKNNGNENHPENNNLS
ncbi:MAG: hypothetical protein ACFE8C_10105 [Promethearchaeota archaeon]